MFNRKTDVQFYAQFLFQPAISWHPFQDLPHGLPHEPLSLGLSKQWRVWNWTSTTERVSETHRHAFLMEDRLANSRSWEKEREREREREGEREVAGWSKHFCTSFNELELTHFTICCDLPMSKWKAMQTYWSTVSHGTDFPSWSLVKGERLQFLASDLHPQTQIQIMEGLGAFVEAMTWLDLSLLFFSFYCTGNHAWFLAHKFCRTWAESSSLQLHPNRRIRCWSRYSGYPRPKRPEKMSTFESFWWMLVSTETMAKTTCFSNALRGPNWRFSTWFESQSVSNGPSLSRECGKGQKTMKESLRCFVPWDAIGHMMSKDLEQPASTNKRQYLPRSKPLQIKDSNNSPQWKSL